MCLGAVLLALVGARPHPARSVAGQAVRERDVVQWSMPDGTRTLIAVAPSHRALRFYAFSDGRPLALAGENPGATPRFGRIHALALSGDLLFVLDGSPARVRILHLPDLQRRATLPLPAASRPAVLAVRRQGRDYRLTLRAARGASAAAERIDWRPGNGAGSTGR